MNLSFELSQIEGCDYYSDYDLTKLTTMRLSSRGDLIVVKKISALSLLLPILIKLNQKYLVLGWGANQILPSKCKQILIHLDFEFDFNYFKSGRDEYVLPASIGLNHLTGHAMTFGLLGWEVFTGIPASLGGAIFMNAGTNLGEIGSIVKSVKIVSPSGELRVHHVTPSSFSYRKNHFLQDGEIIVEATLIHKGSSHHVSDVIKNYIEYRRRTQPLSTKNCGCVFKNPSNELSAGKLIDMLGLKGLTVGELRISHKHANFIENHGNSDLGQFQDLVKTIKFYVEHFYGIEFELEVKIPYH